MNHKPCENKHPLNRRLFHLFLQIHLLQLLHDRHVPLVLFVTLPAHSHQVLVLLQFSLHTVTSHNFLHCVPEERNLVRTHQRHHFSLLHYVSFPANSPRARAVRPDR